MTDAIRLVDVPAQFRGALAARGVIPPENLLADGRLHRCNAEGRGGKGDAAYLLHLDGVPAGGFENWKDGRGWENWRADVGRSLTPEEEGAYRARLEAARRQREAEDAARKAHASVRAGQIWAAALPCTEHPYLTRKGVQAHGARLHGDSLVLCLRDTDGVLHSLQFIDAAGEKRYLSDGRKRACYFAVGKPDGVLCLAEGLATAASIREATGYAVAVAFDAGNLVPTAVALRVKYPDLRIVVCADDDHRNGGNPGKTQATEAARAVGGVVALPDFGSDRPEEATDFNDLHLACGLDAVRRCVDAALSASDTDEPDGAGSDGAAVLDGTMALIRRYISMTSEQAIAVTLWTAHAHAFKAAETTPYLAITSATKRSGKSLLLETLAELVPRPWHTGRVSPAVLTRKIDAETPTLLLDESDAAFKIETDYSEALRSILNTGYRRSGRSSLCVGQGAKITYKDFATFCPKAVAGIGRLPDTVQDRAIPIQLKRRARHEHIERFRQRVVRAEAAPVRMGLAHWAARHVGVLQDARPVLPESLPDRAADVWEPLIAIADLASRSWPDLARRAAMTLTSTQEDTDLGVELLTDIAALLEDTEEDPIGTTDLLDRLKNLDDRPWADWSKGRGLTGHALARLLRPFGVFPTGTVRTGTKTFKGYRRVAFEDALSRYVVIKASQGNEANRNGLELPFLKRYNEEPCDASKSAVRSMNTEGCDDVTLQSPGTREQDEPNPTNAGSDDGDCQV